MQFFRQLNRAGASPISPTRVLKLLEFDAKRIIELGDRAGQDDSAPPRMLVYDREVVIISEVPDCRNILGIGTNS